jgi:hypothetical protein
MIRDRLGDGETGVSGFFVPPILSTLFSIATFNWFVDRKKNFMNTILTLYKNLEVWVYY